MNKNKKEKKRIKYVKVLMTFNIIDYDNYPSFSSKELLLDRFVSVKRFKNSIQAKEFIDSMSNRFRLKLKLK